LEGFILLIAGLITIGNGLYIYFVVHIIYPDAGSSRFRRLNWLLKTFGKLPTALLIGVAGLIPVYFG
jgi:hypothetical protein